MSLHDEYARITPYELALPEVGDAQDLVDEAESEAEARGVDLDDLNAFLTLGAVDAFVRGVAGGEVEPTALHQYGPLAWHLVRFRKAAEPLFLMSTHVARYLVEGAPDGAPDAPEESGYLQLPQHLFWTRAAGDAPESVDGVFWASTPSGILQTLLVSGIRPDRPGLGVVALPPAPVADAPRWLDVVVRGEGDDFKTDLPGAELDALYGIETAGELLKLLARFFAYVQGTSGVVEPVTTTGAGSTPGRASGPEPDGRAENLGAGDADDVAAREPGDGPRPTTLPYRRVGLDAS